MKNQKKLSLNKERVAELSKEAQVKITGGAAAKSGGSTNHGFTCCWCTDIHISNTQYTNNTN